MEKIKKISGGDLANSLVNNNRQYLVGNLASPQELEYIYDEEVEVGFSHYKEFTVDKPHTHEYVTEYQMLLEGYSEIKNLDSGEITTLKDGDFYVVRRGTRYAQKVSADSKILFFKSPGGNDKTFVEVDKETESWLKEEI